MIKTPTEPAHIHRRPITGGYARGEETRLRIIQAAVELFGAGGYERTSTREIAARAGVNAPALQYYFEGKEGLYLACAEYMAKRVQASLAPIVVEVRQRLAAHPDLDGLIDCICAILDRAADFILMTSELESWARFMAWEDLDRDRAPPSARIVIDKSLKLEINSLMCDLVGRITGKQPDDVETRIRVLTLASQVSVFHATRERALHDIGWSDVDEEGLKLIKTIIRHQTTAALKVAALGVPL
jgi:TetR/AcrR family transcriptional regulator, regulator of cefoperazone and chloramphenicol sensitivity